MYQINTNYNIQLLYRDTLDLLTAVEKILVMRIKNYKINFQNMFFHIKLFHWPWRWW